MEASKIVDLYQETVNRLRSDDGEITRAVTGLARGTLRKSIRATLASAGLAEFQPPAPKADGSEAGPVVSVADGEGASDVQ